jgi:hypothetical protein
MKPYTSHKMDAKSYNKRNDMNLRKLGDLYSDEGIYFEPAIMDKTARIMRLNSLTSPPQGCVRQFSIDPLCKVLVGELLEYQYTETLDPTKAGYQKPKDKNDHCVSALEFLCLAVPQFNYELNKNYSAVKPPTPQQTQKKTLPKSHPLSDLDPKPW